MVQQTVDLLSGGNIYGLLNFPTPAATSEITAPTASAWTPRTLLLELLGRDGLPATVRGCREDVQLLAGVDPQAIPHHALLDARLMAGLPLHSQAPYGME